MDLDQPEGICFRCHKPYREPVTDDSITLNGEPVNDPTYTGDPWGELRVSFYGSYGSFVDTVMEALSINHRFGGATLPMQPKAEIVDGVCMTCYSKRSLTLCHECAHALCDFLGISRDEQKKTTSHPAGYLDAHPDHPAWEKDIDWTKSPPERKPDA